MQAAMIIITCILCILLITSNAYLILPRSVIKKYCFTTGHQIDSFHPTSSTSLNLFKKNQGQELIDDQSNVITGSEATGVEGDKPNKEPTAFENVASKGLAGVLAIACAEAIFWALGKQ